MDSNNNDTKVPEDLPEDQALQLNVKDFAYRPKAKAKPQRRELANYSSSINPMNGRNWIDIEPGNHSLSVYEVMKKVIHLLRPNSSRTFCDHIYHIGCAFNLLSSTLD